METAFRSDEHFTQAEFVRWLDERPPDDCNHYELSGGVIVMTPPARSEHGAIEAKIVYELESYARRTGSGKVFGSSAGYELPTGETLEPDASFILASTLACFPKPDPETFLRIVPDLVVEILSPSTARRDRVEKKNVYAKNGVREYWLVDPESRIVSIFCLVDAEYSPAVEVTGGAAESTVLVGLSVDLQTLFAD